MKSCLYLTLLLLIITGIQFSSSNSADDEVVIETVEDSVEVPYESPIIQEPNKVYFSEHFDNPKQFSKRWIKSEAMKEGLEEDLAKYDGLWELEAAQKDSLPGDKGLVLKSKAKHAAISALLHKPFVFKDKPLIVQYEVFLQEGQECGGAYLKLLSDGSEGRNLIKFHDKTPYTIMFGPDKCGGDHKLHFIFKHKNPLNGSFEEKHCQKPKERIEDIFSDKLPHLYTLIMKPDNTFEILVDKKVVNSGSLLEDFVPAVNPSEEIDDPNDTKPQDWDAREKIPDPEATKPEDWDEDAPAQIVDETAHMPDGWLQNESTHIPDPDAVKPADWDTEMDGEWEPPLIENPVCVGVPGCGVWEPPLINNPAFKGKWRPPMIDNPNYKGKWKPKKIKNPDYFKDEHPFRMTTISAVGFEIWSMSKDILFDNIIITEDITIAEKWASDTFDKKRQKISNESVTWWGKLLRKMNYRPKSWAIYAIYCTIPVMFYVYYVYYCIKEESVIQKLANLTNEYPALWGVYILVLSIPVAFILYLCCKRSPSSAPKEREELQQTAEKKKTDEKTDDIEEENEEVEAEDEDVKNDKETEEAEKYSEPESDGNNEATSDEAQSKPPEEGTRKRKVRKE